MAGWSQLKLETRDLLSSPLPVLASDAPEQGACNTAGNLQTSQQSTARLYAFPCQRFVCDGHDAKRFVVVVAHCPLEIKDVFENESEEDIFAWPQKVTFIFDRSCSQDAE